MKTYPAVLTLLVVLSSIVWAIGVDEWGLRTQPDGTTFVYHVFGDEFAGHQLTADGYESAATGWSAPVEGLTAGQAYRFQVRAVNGAVGGRPSVVSNTVTPWLARPTGGSVSVQAGPALEVAWSSVASATGYEVQGQSKPFDSGSWPSAWTTQQANGAQPYVHQGVDADRRYRYRVRARVGETASAWSDTLPGGSGVQPPPGAPTGLTATPGIRQATLRWTGPTHTSITEWQYKRGRVLLVRKRSGGMETIALDRVQTLTVIDTGNSESGSALLGESRGNMTAGKRVALKLIAGTLGGVMGVVIAASNSDDGQEPELGPALYGYLAGIAIGVPTVDVSGVDPHDRSMLSLITSIGVSLGGSVVGAIGGYGLAVSSRNVLWPSILIGPVVGATLASEWWRKSSVARRLSIGLAPNPRGSLSTVVSLRF